jgi:hypothetical protein
MQADCPCCQYVIERAGRTPCSLYGSKEFRKQYCPLVKLWPNGCLAPGSPYSDWAIGNADIGFKLRKSIARAIVKGCDDALKKLK